LAFADDDAVLNRNNNLVKGKEAIKAYFENETLKDVTLDWKPDFIDVSIAGDISYTYGKYTFSGIDQNGEKISSEGNFHTIWKRQKDGSWKYVWD
jgi:ketosteroid isomerase-like protein